MGKINNMGDNDVTFLIIILGQQKIKDKIVGNWGRFSFKRKIGHFEKNGVSFGF